MDSLKYTITRNDEEVPVTIEYKYYRAVCGARGSFGVPLEPDEPEDVELGEVKDDKGLEYTLTDVETVEVIEYILKDVSDSREAAIEDYYDRREDR
jgi:hypothetical protein